MLHTHTCYIHILVHIHLLVTHTYILVHIHILYIQILVTPDLRRLRQEDYKSQATLNCSVGSCPKERTRNPAPRAGMVAQCLRGHAALTDNPAFC